MASTIIIIALFVGLVVSLVTRPKVITLSDVAPTERRNDVMRLQSEIKPYTYLEDGKVCLKVVKKKERK